MEYLLVMKNFANVNLFKVYISLHLFSHINKSPLLDYHTRLNVGSHYSSIDKPYARCRPLTICTQKIY